MKFINITYAELKDFLSNKKLILQYVDRGDRYELFIVEGNVSWETTILKNSADGTDFETNYKDTSNKPFGLKSKVLEEEEGKETGGHYQSKSFEIVVDATTGWKDLELSFPFPVALLSASWVNKSENDGDEVQFLVGEQTTIGTISSDVVTGQNVIPVSDTVVQNARIGAQIRLTDGTLTEDLGRITNIDKGAKEITVENNITLAFLAATPTYVKMTVEIVPRLVLVGDNVPMVIGESKIGASHVSANTVLKARYNNISGTAKTFSFVLEYLY